MKVAVDMYKCQDPGAISADVVFTGRLTGIKADPAASAPLPTARSDRHDVPLRSLGVPVLGEEAARVLAGHRTEPRRRFAPPPTAPCNRLRNLQ